MKREEPKNKENLNHQWSVKLKIELNVKDTLLDSEPDKVETFIAPELDQLFSAWGKNYERKIQDDNVILKFQVTYTHLTRGKELPEERMKQSLLDGFVFNLKFLFSKDVVEKGCTFEQLSDKWVYLK